MTGAGGKNEGGVSNFFQEPTYCDTIHCYIRQVSSLSMSQVSSAKSTPKFLQILAKHIILRPFTTKICTV